MERYRVLSGIVPGRGERCWQQNGMGEHHSLLGEGGLRSAGDLFQNTLIFVTTDTKFNQGIPLVLGQEILIHFFDYFVHCTLSEFVSPRCMVRTSPTYCAVIH